MRKALLLTVMLGLLATMGYSQTDKSWSAHMGGTSLVTDKAVARKSFPSMFKLYDLNIQSLKQDLYSVTGNSSRHSTRISLPNTEGQLEEFEVVEASNFEPALQARFPEIRAFSGTGITDRSATLKLSLSPQGIQTMIFRTEKENEFIEPYSKDHKTYAVFKSSREKGKLPWTCSTEDRNLVSDIHAKVDQSDFTNSSSGELKTMRLAQSCNGEYSNFFNAFSSADVALVLAAFNATLTRCNGVYEKDLALHLNLINNTTDVIFYDPATDPYTTLSNWNLQLQQTLTANIESANYDIGHMFGASGGGGNAGCIGCVCVDPVNNNSVAKGGGITSPADGIPMGDNFDIDYVVHEVGHQLGGNHTFSFSNEGTGVNKEIGSGITIMGYAGITNQDVAPHSIDIFHEASIQQIQTNLATKTCPVTTVITANNATPVVAPVSNYTIPISTPFVLTGTATDANAGDVLTYCWEQNDNGTSATTGASSNASPTKTVGPNWLTFSPALTGVRIFPKLTTVLAGQLTTGNVGGSAGILTEALSSVGRTLNFRLTVRDNSVYSSTAPLKVGQTAFTDMVVTVAGGAGPFAVTSPNTNVSWSGLTSQTITWSVNNTTAAPVNCANVKISLSTDGGLTFPTVLAASTPNDGTELLTIPNTPSATARIKVEAIGNIFFDISNTNFTITVPVASYTFSATTPATVACSGAATAAVTLGTSSIGGYVVPVNLSATAGVPAGTTVSFSTNPVVPGNSTVVTLNNVNTLTAGTYNITITGVSGSITQTTILTYVVSPGTPPVITTAPASVAACVGSSAVFTVLATGTVTYQWQVSTDNGASWNNVAGATSTTLTVPAVTTAQNGYAYRVIVTSQCSTATSSVAILTVQTAPSIAAAGQPANTTVCAGTNASFTVTATGGGLTYQWQLSTDNGATWSDVAGATSATITVTAVTNGQNGNRYRAVVTGSCSPAVTSNSAALTVGDAASITSSPSSTVVCVGATPTFTVVAAGTNLTYQWQISTDNGITFTNIAGATSSTYTLPAVTATQTGNQYRAIVFSCTPTGITSAAATLTVNIPVNISSQPVASTVCSGTATSFTVAASGTGVTYQWQYAATCAGTFTNITGATSATFSLSSVALANGGAYRVVVSGACGPVTSNCVLLTVNSPIVISAQPSDFTACLPETGTINGSFTVTATGTALTYQWQVSTDGGATYTNIAGATSATYTISPLAASMNGYKYKAILNGTCTSNLSTNVVNLVVNTLAKITSQPVAVVTCSEAAATFSVAATGSTITYQWQVSVNGGPFVNLTNGAPYSGVTTNTLTVANVNTGISGYVYRVVVSSVPCGPINSNAVSLTVNPKPAVVLTLASNPAVNPGIRTTLSTTVSPLGNYSYQWYRNSVLVPTITSASFPVSVDDLGEYKVVVTNVATGCSSTSNNVTVTDAPSNNLFIYPNPSSGVFQVRYFNRGGGSINRNLTIYDSKGSIVFTKQYSVSGAYGKMEVNLTGAGKGVYMVDLRDAAGKRLASGNVIIQ